MIFITDNISYTPTSREPLSAEVFFIKKNEKVYIYDVGNNDISLHHINQVNKKKTIIL